MQSKINFDTSLTTSVGTVGVREIDRISQLLPYLHHNSTYEPDSELKQTLSVFRYVSLLMKIIMSL